MPVTNPILINQTITSNGSALHHGDPGQEVSLLWNVTGPVTGVAPTLQFTLQEVDPADEVTANGSSATGSLITGTGVGTVTLSLVKSPTILVSWVVGGVTPSFGGTNATSVGKLVGNEVAVVGVPGGPAITVDQGDPNSNPNAWPTKVSDGTDTVGISTVSGSKALKVDVIQSVGGSGGTNSSFGAPFPAAGTAAGFNDGTDMRGAKVFDADTGGGTEYVLGVELRKAASGGSVEAGTVSDPLRVDPTGATTQPVSGTVTANQGTAAAPGGAWPVEITDGTNVAAVKAASTPAVATDPALVVAISPNNPIVIATTAQTWAALTGGSVIFSTPALGPHSGLRGTVSISVQATGRTGPAVQLGVIVSEIDPVDLLTPVSQVEIDLASPSASRDRINLRFGGPLTVAFTVTDPGTTWTGVTILLTEIDLDAVALANTIWDVGTDDPNVSITGLVEPATQTIRAATAFSESGTDSGDIAQGVSLRGYNPAGGSYPLGDSDGAHPLRVDPTGTTTQPVSDGGGSLTVDGTVQGVPGGAPVQVASGDLATEETQTFLRDYTLDRDRSLYEQFRTGQKTSDKSLPVVIAGDQSPVSISGGVLDPNNSTTTPLGAGGIWTGSYSSCVGYDVIQVYIHTDVPSAVGGVQVYWDHDGSGANARIDDGQAFSLLFDPLIFPLRIKGPFFKISYTNDVTGQTLFQLATVLKIAAPDSTVLPGLGIRASNSDEQSRASLTAGATDSFVATVLRVASDGTVRVDPTGTTTQPVSVISAAPVSFDPGTTDIFGQLVVASRSPQILVPFFQADPATLLTVTTSGSGSTSRVAGAGVFATGATSGSEAKGVSLNTVTYSAHYELYAAFTAAFTSGVAGSVQRIGLYDATNGFSFGYNGTTFGLWINFKGSDNFAAKSSWNTDTLTGAVGSKFTSNGSPVAFNPTAMNVFRIRFGWLGIANIVFEVLAPDGNFVVVHVYRAANNIAFTSVHISNPNLPMTIDVTNPTVASDISVTCGCWVAGSTSPGSHSVVNGAGTIAALNSAVTIQTIDQSALAFNITGSWVGTLTFQFSVDGGSNWTNDLALDSLTGAFVSSSTTNRTIEANVSAYRLYRIVATAWTSGTATINYNCGGGASNVVTTLSKITDAANNGPAAVKPANTPAQATDAALVVAIAPNSGPVISPVAQDSLAREVTLATLASEATLAFLRDLIVEIDGWHRRQFGTGQKPSSSSLPVVVATDQSPVPTTGGIQDSNNSTATLLSAGATFNGGYTSCTGYDVIQLSALSDVASAMSGVQIQWATDSLGGSSWVDQDQQFTFVGGSTFPTTYQLKIRAPYFSVRYINGNTSQTSFALYSVLKVVSSDPTILDGQRIHTFEISRPSLVAGSDGLNAHAILTDTVGATAITSRDGRLALDTSLDKLASQDTLKFISDLLVETDGWQRRQFGTGRKPNATSLPVTIASSSTPVLTNVTGSSSSVTLLAANAARVGATIFNDSSANLYIKPGTTASTTSFTVLMLPNSYYEVPFGYIGRIDGIWASATGNARVTEFLD
jgi:hypothetical protein